MIDEDFRVWLIEVNTNPYFGVPNAYIAGLLPKMMDDLLDIVLDPIYKPLNKPESKQIILIFRIALERPNEFELIYCENNSAHSNVPVNKRRPFNVSLYPVPELAQPVGHKAPKVKILT